MADAPVWDTNPIYEIPLVNQAQTLRISLNGVYYRLNVYWNSFSSNWNIDIANDKSVPIVTSIPLIANVDLLHPYDYLGFGGKLVALTDNKIDMPPTYDNLGTTGHLYFVVEPYE